MNAHEDTTALTIVPPRYFVPICIWWPWGHAGGPAWHMEMLDEETGEGPIVVLGED